LLDIIEIIESTRIWCMAMCHACKFLVTESEDKPHGSPRYRWEHNIKMDVNRNGMEWCGLDPHGFTGRVSLQVL
jgi:hypothetical protein